MTKEEISIVVDRLDAYLDDEIAVFKLKYLIHFSISELESLPLETFIAAIKIKTARAVTDKLYELDSLFKEEINDYD